jgi:hypothetical protein
MQKISDLRKCWTFALVSHAHIIDSATDCDCAIADSIDAIGSLNQGKALETRPRPEPYAATQKLFNFTKDNKFVKFCGMVHADR